jgi:hypothetical protein
MGWLIHGFVNGFPSHPSAWEPLPLLFNVDTGMANDLLQHCDVKEGTRAMSLSVLCRKLEGFKNDGS